MVVLVLSAGIASVMLLFLLFNVAAPGLKIINVNYVYYREDAPRVFVNGTVMNSSTRAASNVTVTIYIYVSRTPGEYEYEGAGGSGPTTMYTPADSLLANIEAINLGTVSGNSAKNFEASVTYAGYRDHEFAGIQCDLSP